MVKATFSDPVAVSDDSLLNDFRALGISHGDTLLVHSSLSRIGWVHGGPIAVIKALQAALGHTGTLVMPAHTSHISEPALWRNPRAPAESIDTIRSTMPAFDPLVTPSRGMGVIAECLRSQPGVLRSAHPQDSFIARGPAAGKITAVHTLDNGLGEQSPLARLYELDAKILLLGVGHDSNTSIHLSENRANYAGKRQIKNGAPVLVDGKRVWTEFEHLEYNVADFRQIGQAFASQTDATSCSFVGRAQSQLFPMRRLVDFAVDWINANR
ncbi:MAG: AAC(3) family N-acetyltransferase [Gammaproteobacteria bacterium]|nr:AAC(3) family N-acetyltransferase [Gammaproteobacteria bacterium]